MLSLSNGLGAASEACGCSTNHATIYVIANFVILLVDISTPGGAWFYDVLLGWGLFLGLHALYAYELVPWSTLDWEHRTVKKLIEFRLRK